jgi:hypothetical protein
MERDARHAADDDRRAVTVADAGADPVANSDAIAHAGPHAVDIAKRGPLAQPVRPGGEGRR